LGLLTKIFGNPEGGASNSGESSPVDPAAVAADGEDAGRATYTKGHANGSGVRPAMDTTPPRSREPRTNGPNRRPEHPRMYLRPTPATVDPAVPGSTRRQQISVRVSLKETTRITAPPAKRSAVDPATPRRERPSEPGASSSPRPPGTRPKTAMVVSPVSLTPEELQLPLGRQKMPTLLGLGAALRAPHSFGPASSDSSEGPGAMLSDPPSAPSSEAQPAASSAVVSSEVLSSDARASGGTGPDPEVDDSIELEASDLDTSEVDLTGSSLTDQHVTEPSDPNATNGEAGEDSVRARRDSGIETRGQWSSPEEPADVAVPDDLTPMAQLLADFALKLSLGPVSLAWVPEVRRSAEALLATGKQRHETALAAVSARLLELLPAAPREAEGELPFHDVATHAEQAPLDGSAREGILHEVSRLAGLLPEWPAAAQDLAEEARRREARVLRELLSSVDGLKRDQRARLEEQSRLEELADMSSEALAEEFVAPIERAEEIGQLLAGYRRERRTRAPDLGNLLGLRLAIGELERRNDEFEDCDPEQKETQRVVRGNRRQAMTAVQLLLAERGELDQLDQLEPLSFGERVERLRQWLDAASEKAY
jgi:hypothetical protein